MVEAGLLAHGSSSPFGLPSAVAPVAEMNGQLPIYSCGGSSGLGIIDATPDSLFAMNE